MVVIVSSTAVTVSTATSTAEVPAAPAVAATAGAPLGHSVDFHALPLGDGKYVTTGPKKGYVYLCNVMQGGGGSQVNGPWIGATTWDATKKVSVEGTNSWPNASVSISVSGATRTITSNDLPTVGTTGNFPISPSDPAYEYDTNPNSIEAQNLSFSLPATPTIAAAPSCIYGEVGVMTNGVLLLDGFDELYHDAEAHEIQDSCDGHPHEGGVYHYHSLSSCIPNATATNIIGYAFDGFPITGPKLSDGSYITSADLDECHGETSDILENGKMVNTYHYVMTYDFPYSVSCFKGTSYEPKPSPNQGGMNMQMQNGPMQGMPPPPF
jgi:hypothetical protein